MLIAKEIIKSKAVKKTAPSKIERAKSTERKRDETEIRPNISATAEVIHIENRHKRSSIIMGSAITSMAATA